jgi:hypothetical protein
LPGPEDPRAGAPAVKRHTRSDGRDIAESAPARHYDGAAVLLVAQHLDLLGAEEPSDLLRDRGEDLHLGRLARDERRHSAQRRLLVGEPFDLGLGPPALRHVARDPVHHAGLGDGRRLPLEDAVRAVLADVAVLKSERRIAPTECRRFRRRPFTVVGMDEVAIRPLEQLLLRVTENLLGSRVDAGEVSVEVGDRDQVVGEREDAVEVGLRLGAARRIRPERRREAGENQARREDDPRQGHRGTAHGCFRHEDFESLARHGERLGALAWSR